MWSIVAVVVVLALGLWALSRYCYEPFTNATLALTRRLLGVQRRSAVVDGQRVVYLEIGRGEPLLLLHGLGADKDNFLLTAWSLRRRFRVIVPDLPGFGDSDKPLDASYRVPVQVERLRAFARALGAPRFHVGGNSMGGLIAGAYAAIHPEDTLSLWLLAPAGVKAAKPSVLMTAIANRAEQLPIFARDVREMRQLIAFATGKPMPMPYCVLATMAAQQQRNATLHRRIVDEMVEGPWLDELLASKPPTPTLIVWGDQDRALDVSGAAVLHALLPHSTLIVMPGIGHIPMIEAPRRAVRDYLAFQAALTSSHAG